MGTNVIHSLCVSASVPLIARKRCLRVSLTLRVCVHCRTPFLYCHTLSGYAYNRVLMPLCWLNILSYRPSSYRYWLCRVLLCSRNTYAKLLTCYGYMMATRILRRSQSVLCCRHVHWWPRALLSTVVCVCIIAYISYKTYKNKGQHTHKTQRQHPASLA